MITSPHRPVPPASPVAGQSSGVETHPRRPGSRRWPPRRSGRRKTVETLRWNVRDHQHAMLLGPNRRSLGALAQRITADLERRGEHVLAISLARHNPPQPHALAQAHATLHACLEALEAGASVYIVVEEVDVVAARYGCLEGGGVFFALLEELAGRPGIHLVMTSRSCCGGDWGRVRRRMREVGVRVVCLDAGADEVVLLRASLEGAGVQEVRGWSARLRIGRPRRMRWPWG